MASQRTEFMLPVGRLVMGSLYDPETTDNEGNPLVVKNGPNKGQPRVQYFVAVAIPKAGEAHWSQTAWGAQIAAVGQQAFPQVCQSPVFSWKVDDGDSQIPNMKGRKPCDNEGWRGHWIVKASSGYAPKLYNSNGSAELTTPNAIVPGYYVQMFVSVVSNNATGQAKPGVIVNCNAVALQGYGEEIRVGRDYSSVGFGQGVALPPGASATPVGQAPASLPGGFPAPAAAPGFPAPAAPAPAAMPPAAAPAPLNIPPNPAFLGTPAVPATPPAPPPAVPQMTPKAAGATYESFIAGGWTPEQMRQGGYLL